MNRELAYLHVHGVLERGMLGDDVRVLRLVDGFLMEEKNA